MVKVAHERSERFEAQRRHMEAQAADEEDLKALLDVEKERGKRGGKYCLCRSLLLLEAEPFVPVPALIVFRHLHYGEFFRAPAQFHAFLFGQFDQQR